MNLNCILLPLILTATTAAAVPPDYQPDPEREVTTSGAMSNVPCVGGSAIVDGQEFHCEDVDVLSYLPLTDMGCGGFTGNDIWGWTDPDTGREYALMGCENGTSFVDVSDPLNPEYIGFLPTHPGSTTSTWRDIKVYADHAYVVSDHNPAHGMQVFDLTRLRTVATPPETFDNDAWYDGIGSAHNVVINEETGYAYIVGGPSGAQCAAGLHMVNIQQPQSPTFAGCFADDGYTHDAQCVIYNGPDEDHQGSEICFNANEDTLTIVDVTDKELPDQLSRNTYVGSSYAHQGWLTEDHRYFLLDDELDESDFGHNTRTYIWDVSELESPVLIDFHQSTEPDIDHNQYVKGIYTYQSNYTAGLRILDLLDIADGILNETAYFNFMPHDDGLRHDKDGPGFAGTWSNYPYFESGIVIVSVRGTGSEPGGLWTMQPRLPGVITGVVTRSDTGEPLEGARVDVEGPGDLHDFTVADGSYRIDTTPGTYPVTASMEGFPDETETAVETTEGGHIVVDFALETPPGQLEVSPLTHDFGEIDAGETAGPLEITVANAAQEPARTLTLIGVEVGGEPAFHTGAGTCDEGLALAPQESCVLELFFTPDAATVFEGEINVLGDDEQTASVAVSGTGLPSKPAVLAVEPAALAFGEVFAGDTATATLTVSNAAEGDVVDLVLTQLDVIAGTSDFTRVGGSCAEDMALASGQSCGVDIQFAPDAPGTFSGVFRVGANGELQNVSLSGNGIEPDPVVFDDRFEGL